MTDLSVGRPLLFVLVDGWFLFSVSGCCEDNSQSEQLHKFGTKPSQHHILWVLLAAIIAFLVM